MIISQWILLRIRNISDKSCRENQNTHFMFDNFYCRKSWLLWDNVEKYFRAGQAADDKMAHAHCILSNSGYNNTLTICNTYRFSTTTMVARTCLNVTVYVHCLSCSTSTHTHTHTHTLLFLYYLFWRTYDLSTDSVCTGYVKNLSDIISETRTVTTFVTTTCS